jgi:hypothetical protein
VVADGSTARINVDKCNFDFVFINIVLSQTKCILYTQFSPRIFFYKNWLNVFEEEKNIWRKLNYR